MKPSLLRKFIAALLAGTTFFVQCALGDLSQASIWKERRASRPPPTAVQMASLPLEMPGVPARLLSPHPAAPPLPSPSRATPLARALAGLPSDRVTIVEAGDAGRRPPVIVLQDIHLNVEAQANIAATVEALSNSNAIGSVHLEGAFGPLRFERFRFFSPEARRRITEALVNAGAVGGASAAAVTAERLPLMVGADDEAAYRANVAALRQSVRRRAAIESEIETWARSISIRKAAIYSPRLRAFDRLLIARAEGRLSLGDQMVALRALGLERSDALDRFLSAVRLERALDFTAAERERRAVLERLASRLSPEQLSALWQKGLAFRAGRLGFAAFYADVDRLCRDRDVPLSAFPAFRRYLRYVALADGIDVRSLLPWIDDAVVRLGDRIAQTRKEKDLLAEDRALALARRLVEFQLTPHEWTRWSVERTHLPPSLSGKLAPFEDFYHQADVRTEALVKSALSARGDQPRLLVAGGFHTPGLVQALRRAGVPYAVLSPRLTHSESAPTAYLGVFTREKTPLEKLFAGEKLTINPEAQVWGGSTPASRASGLNELCRTAATDFQNGRAVDPRSGVTASRRTQNVVATKADGKEIDVAFGDEPGYKPWEPEPIGGTRIVEPELAGTPGAWAGAWQGTINLLTRLLGERNALRLRPFVAGAGEGLIAGVIAAAFPGSGAAVLAWLALTLVMHYVYGVFWWNPDLNGWDVIRYLRRAQPQESPDEGDVRAGPFILRMPDRYYFRANMVAATSALGFLASALDGGLTLTLLFATVPHILTSYTQESRINEERRRAIEETKRQFEEAQRIMRLARHDRAPHRAEIAELIETLESRNDLASFMRFNEGTNGRYRLAMIMQPGSTAAGEGAGFKTLNDTLGYSLMNQVFPERNAQAWRIAQAVFHDLESRAGKPVVTRIGANNKVLRFAIDMDAVEGLFESKAEMEGVLTQKLDEVARLTSEAMVNLLTKVNGATTTIGNKGIVSAVRLAQAKGKLPQGLSVPIYWGLSTDAARGHLDAALARDAEATAAINAVRSLPVDGRPRGQSFSVSGLRDNLLETQALAAELKSRGVIQPTFDPRAVARLVQLGTHSYDEAVAALTVDRVQIPIAKALRKKKDPEMVGVLARVLGKNLKKDRAELERTLTYLRKYASRLAVFDNIKPWVGSKERPESEDVARKVNDSITALRALADGAEPVSEDAWRALQPKLEEALRRDPRMPELGSQFEFYGLTVPENPDDEMAAMFVDFRDFGALIFGELEGAAAELAPLAAAGSDAELEAAFAEKSLVLGDPVLDPFADSLRKIHRYFEQRYGARSGLHFYFGGDDVTIVLPRKLVYPADPDTPDGSLISDILRFIPLGMRVRTIAASNTPYLTKQDATLGVAMMLQDADELATTAKSAEETWQPRGKPVEEVVAYSDRVGAHHRAPVFNRKPGRSEVVFPGHDDTTGFLVKWLMSWYKQVIDKSGDDVAARQWAEKKAEESLILLGALVALVELPLFPVFPILLNNFAGPAAAIAIGAVVMVLFHELTLLFSATRRFVYRRLLGWRVPRPAPPGPWTDRFFVRVTARLTAALVILTVAFLPLFPLMAPGHVLPFDSLWAFYPSITTAYLLHLLWNIYVPPAWRLSLLPMPDDPRFHERTTGEEAPIREVERLRSFNSTDAPTREELVALVDSLPLELDVAHADRETHVLEHASRHVYEKTREWRKSGLLSASDADLAWREFSEALRRLVTGRREDGLSLQSIPTLQNDLRADAERGAKAGHETVIVRFIDLDEEGAPDKIRTALASRGSARVAFVVKGDASAIERRWGAVATIVPWTEGLRMTEVESAVAASWGRRDGLTNEAARALVARAAVRLLVDDGFDLPPTFLEGVSDLNRYQVFVLVTAALLAVELRPDRIGEAAALAAVVARQA